MLWDDVTSDDDWQSRMLNQTGRFLPTALLHASTGDAAVQSFLRGGRDRGVRPRRYRCHRLQWRERRGCGMLAAADGAAPPALLVWSWQSGACLQSVCSTRSHPPAHRVQPLAE